MSCPLKLTSGTPEAVHHRSQLHKLEHLLCKPVAFVILPISGFAHAGVSFAGISMSVFFENLNMAIAAGLLLGKPVGVLGTVALLVKLGVADLPAQASWGQVAGTALLCDIGFTMSLFIGHLAFDDVGVQDQAKIGVLAGSVLSGVLGAVVLSAFGRRRATA